MKKIIVLIVLILLLFAGCKSEADKMADKWKDYDWEHPGWSYTMGYVDLLDGNMSYWTDHITDDDELEEAYKKLAYLNYKLINMTPEKDRDKSSIIYVSQATERVQLQEAIEELEYCIWLYEKG